jgi:hypothetical protein
MLPQGEHLLIDYQFVKPEGHPNAWQGHAIEL